MREIIPNLFVGSLEDLQKWPRDKFAIAACKEPCHREALGYTGRGAPKDHPEYLVARRGNRLILNLVDGPSHKFIDVPMIQTALNAISVTEPMLIACNQGMSRSPTLAMMWLNLNGYLSADTFIGLEKQFKELYPLYQPYSGIRDFADIYLFHPGDMYESPSGNR